MERKESENPDIDIESLYDQMATMRGKKSRISPTEKELVEQYTARVQEELTYLQQQHLDLVEHRDFVREQLRDLQNMCREDLDRKNEHITSLTEENLALKTHNMKLQRDLDEARMEYHNLQSDYEVMQVDMNDVQEKNVNLHAKNREWTRKYVQVKKELEEADKSTTKRLNRLVSYQEMLEADSKKMQEKIEEHETDIEASNLMCFICRSFMQRETCFYCGNKVCRKCFANLDACPFCRHDFAEEEVLV